MLRSYPPGANAGLRIELCQGLPSRATSSARPIFAGSGIQASGSQSTSYGKRMSGSGHLRVGRTIDSVSGRISVPSRRGRLLLAAVLILK